MQRKQKRFGVLVLAAGKGTRMYSKTPKVLQKMLEEPLLYYPLSAAKKSGFDDIAVMVGYMGELVETWLSSSFPEAAVLWQREQNGTAHAVSLAKRWWSDYDNVLILPGDTPLITPETLAALANRHIESGNACTFLSFEADDPYGYGRVVRDGGTVRIVEQRDASDEERKIREVNSGMYVFDTKALSSVIDKIGCENSQKEYYLTDALQLIQDNGGSVGSFKAEDPSEVIGVNDAKQLALAACVMRNGILGKWMACGVKCMDPASVWIGPKVTLGEDVVIEPDVQIWGSSSIGAGSRIGSFTAITDAELEENVSVTGFVRIKGSKIGRNSSVGPFVFIRDEAVLAEDVHVGRFVEIKKSLISSGAKVPHLSYIGDAKIGMKTNIGAGTITCNYDGEKKNMTVIGDNCFIGSDTMLVAPVTIGDNAVTAAGSVITSDVPEGALGIARARQKNIDGWYFRKKNIRGGNK